jgi:excisionase family DNA binding protein
MKITKDVQKLISLLVEKEVSKQLALHNKSVEPKEVLSKKEAAEFLGIGLTTLHHLIKDKKIITAPLGPRRVIIPQKSVKDYLDGILAQSEADRQFIKTMKLS